MFRAMAFRSRNYFNSSHLERTFVIPTALSHTFIKMPMKMPMTGMTVRSLHSTNILLGAVRKPLNSKKGNKNFYKGSRSKKTGIWSQKGNFITQEFR